MRRDVYLTMDVDLVLLCEDGGLFLRVLRRGDPPTYVTPKAPVTADALRAIRTNGNQRLEAGAFSLVLFGPTVGVVIEGQVVGWGGRVPLTSGIAAFLRTCGLRSSLGLPG